MSRILGPEALRAVCDPASLPFDTTAKLVPLDGMVGQARAVEATAFGIGMRRPGYNLFVVGASRTGKTSTMRRGLALLSGREAGERGPDGRFPEGSFNAAVDAALAENVDRLRQLRAP